MATGAPPVGGRPGASRPSVFARIGAFSVRHRWAVLAGWLVATVAAIGLLPSLGGVIDNDSAAFLPPSAPSVQAAHLAATFLTGSSRTGELVAVDAGAPLSPADQAAISGIESRLRRLPLVSVVHDGATSADGRARTALVEFAASTGGGGPQGASAVSAVRRLVAEGAPAGVVVHLTGPLPELVDQQAAARHTANRAELLSAVLIVVLLLLAFRAGLAPLVTLAPAGLALALAGPLIAESTRAGVQVSSLTQLLLTALVLGAGTDYGLFFMFRYREELARGSPPAAAIVRAAERVGQSITFSAATVIAALLALLLASFGLYRGVGPGLALGVLVVLMVDLTLLPALLAILGRAVFWPWRPAPRARPPWWGRVAQRVTRRPLLALGIGIAALGGLSTAVVAYSPSGFDAGGYIAGSDSAAGQQALRTYFGTTPQDDTDVLFRLASPVWDRPAVLERAQQLLQSSGEFTAVLGPLDAGGVPLPPGALSFAYDHLGPPGDLPATPPPSVAVPDALYDAYRSTASSIGPSGRTLLYTVSLRAGASDSTAALQAVPAVRRAVAEAAAAIGATRSGVAGQAASAADVSAISASDIARISPVVLVVLALLLGIVLRSLVAPLYLVASVALSYLASLGLAVLVFVVLGGQLGVNFTLPFFLFVFIMALGEDYNILVMSRIREEAARLPLRAAVANALGTTGPTVTSAGLVLAGTFGVLAATTSGQVQQIATGLSLGVLLDSFVVRTLLVPSVVVLLGRHNWWPSPLGRRAAGPSGPRAKARRPQPVAAGRR